MREIRVNVKQREKKMILLKKNHINSNGTARFFYNKIYIYMVHVDP